MITTDTELLILELVAASDGRRDTRSLDFEYYSRSSVLLEPNLLHVLRDFERRGLVESVPVEGGAGPGWTLTDMGGELLNEADRRPRDDDRA